MKHQETLVVGGVDRTPIATMPPLRMSAARCSARRSLRRPGTATASSFPGCRASASSPWSASSRRAATRPGWFAICARRGCGCSRSTSPYAHARRRVGKSDPIDAELAARAALAGQADAIPKPTDGIVDRSATCAWRARARSRPAAPRWCSSGTWSSRLPGRCASSSPSPRRSAARRASAAGCGPPQASSSAPRSPRASRCARWRGVSRPSTRRSPRPTSSSSGWSAAPRRARPRCSASRPATPDSCSSAPGKTSSAWAVRARSPRSAAPVRSRRPRARPPATGSTTAATARCT
jgi:hypothetical protein